MQQTIEGSHSFLLPAAQLFSLLYDHSIILRTLEAVNKPSCISRQIMSRYDAQGRRWIFDPTRRDGSRTTSEPQPVVPAPIGYPRNIESRGDSRLTTYQPPRQVPAITERDYSSTQSPVDRMTTYQPPRPVPAITGRDYLSRQSAVPEHHAPAPTSYLSSQQPPSHVSSSGPGHQSSRSSAAVRSSYDIYQASHEPTFSASSHGQTNLGASGTTVPVSRSAQLATTTSSGASRSSQPSQSASQYSARCDRCTNVYYADTQGHANGKLNRHRTEKHSNAPRPECPFCDVDFAPGRTDDLQRHIRQYHPERAPPRDPFRQYAPR